MIDYNLIKDNKIKLVQYIKNIDNYCNNNHLYNNHL